MKEFILTGMIIIIIVLLATRNETWHWFGKQVGFVDSVLAIRKGKWKLIDGKQTVAGAGQGAREDTLGTDFQLYDLSTDIGERSNIANDHPDIVHELATKLSTIRVKR